MQLADKPDWKCFIHNNNNVFREIVVHLSASSVDLLLCSINMFLNDLASYKCCQYDI